MTTDDMEIVSAIACAMADKVGKERFELWFGDSVRMELDSWTLTVFAPNSFLLDRLRQAFRHDLSESAASVLGGEVRLAFQIDPQASAPKARTSVRGKRRPPAESVTDEVPPRIPPGLSRYVAGPCNQVAFTSANLSLERLGRVSPLFLYGPNGCGKTLLLECMQRSARRRLRSGRVVLLSAEQFTSFFLEALQGSGLPNFRRKYRDLDLLLIDDVQFFSGKRATLVELHHTIDTLHRGGRQIVFAADRSPMELTGVNPEVSARMSAGMVSAMEPVDRDTRRSILERMNEDRKLNTPSEALDLIADRLAGDARLLSGALNRLEALSLAHGQPITASMADDQLDDLFRLSQPLVRLPDIEEAVCDVFGLTRSSLQSGEKARWLSQPRMLAMWLARKHTQAAYSEIGRFFGKRSHSTVISAEKKVDHWMNEDAAVKTANGECQVRDALRRIETHLRSG